MTDPKPEDKKLQARVKSVKNEFNGFLKINRYEIEAVDGLTDAHHASRDPVFRHAVPP